MDQSVPRAVMIPESRCSNSVIVSFYFYYQLYGQDKIEASNSQKLSILYYLGYISLAQSFHFHGKFYKFQLSSCWYHFERSG